MSSSPMSRADRPSAPARTFWAHLIYRLKPRTSVMRTTLVISIVVLVSQVLSIAFFWKNIYLPEVRQHAHTAALRLQLLEEAERAGRPVAEIDRALLLYGKLRVVRDPAEFPEPMEKWFAELFTNRFKAQLETELQAPVQVYFVFKPHSTLWIKPPTKTPLWVSEELLFIQQYSPGIMVGWLLGVPLLSVIAIVVLARQLNRPLKRLQMAAIRVGRGLHSTHLDEYRGPVEIRAVNRAFNQMTRQIRESERERTIMLAGISHDLRTPLTRLRLSAEMMDDREMAHDLIADVEDMDAILGQFIAFMRDGSEEPLEDTDLNTLLQEAAASFQAQIAVQITAGEIPARMPLRRLSIKRLLGNLIQNAIRYGAGPVALSTTVSGRQVMLTCRDHGPGIEQADMDAMLMPFQRGEQARTTQGSGLGLAIVARIVRQHHGQLQLRNHPEGGLEVTISLPLRGMY